MQLIAVAIFMRPWITERVQEGRQEELTVYSFSVVIMAFLTWTLAAKMIWWSPPQDWYSISKFVWYLVPVTAVLFGLGLFPPVQWKFEIRGRWVRVLDSAAVLFFLLPSMRVNLQFIHTGFYVGPANLVRQGGWLLWDVPSQYGFLNILLVGTLPGVSSWQAFWLINGTLIFLSACITYALLRNMMTGALGVFAAFLGTIAAIYYLPGCAPDLTGPTTFPSTGAMRFFFPYALMALIFLNLKKNGAKLWSRELLSLGNFIWLFGFLWAVESAIYSTLIWYSILISIAWGRGFKTAVKILLTPPAMLLAAWGVISLYYKIYLGSFPDLLGYLDFALAYQGGYGALPVALDGTVWLLILMFSCVAYTAYLVTNRAPWLLGGIAGAGAMLVSTATYFVSRSHENNVSNLFPLFLVGVAIAILHVETIPELRRKVWMLKLLLIPFLTIGFAVPLAISTDRFWWSEVLSIPGTDSIHNVIPAIPAPVKSLFEKGGVKAGDPVTALTEHLLGSPAPYRDWLPLAPAMEIDILSTEAQAIYLDRFMERAPSNGWLLTTNPLPALNYKIPSIANLVFERLSKSHDLVSRFEEENWVLLRYERKTAK